MRIPRPTPSTIIATAALAVALGGTGYAAVTLPRNSVGTAQLKANAVTSAKVKDGSLRAADFATGQLPKGDTGATGATGATGPAGAQGERGPSDAYISSLNASINIPNSMTTVRSLSLPAGKYLLQAGGMVSYDASGTSLVRCQMDWTGRTTPLPQDATAEAANAAGTIALVDVATFTGTTTVTLACQSGRGSTGPKTANFEYPRIVAVQVATITGS